MSAAIEFRDVSFAISRDRLLLDDISLALEEGPRPPSWAAAVPAKQPCCAPSIAWSSPPGATYSCMERICATGDLIALRRSMGYVIQETGPVSAFHR